MKDEEEKLRGVYQTMICMSCGKSFPFNSELISFICDNCIAMNFCIKPINDVLEIRHNNGLEELLEEFVEEVLEDMYLQSKKDKPTSMLHFIIKYTCPKCKKGKCETITTQDGDYTFIVCKNFAEYIFKMMGIEDK